MSSEFFRKQLEAFKESSAAASAKLTSKRTIGSPALVPSPRPSTPSTSTIVDHKRKRPESNTTVYSQPADTGTGQELLTKMSYVIEKLKTKTEPQTLKQISSFLSLQTQPNADQLERIFAKLLRDNDRIEFIRDPKRPHAWDSGSFRFRPKHRIYTGTDLLAFLQAQHSAQGLPVKDIKDGWPDCEDTIDELETQGRLLVTRNKKDNHARMVWPNDPSLTQEVDREFQTRWHKIKIPLAGDLPGELEKSGLKPSSTDPSKLVKKMAVKKEKPRRARRGGKQTNTHMAGILRDYSGMKR